jgi:propionyl-CoA synthetase
MVGGMGAFDASIADPEVFWADTAQDMSSIREPRRILEDSRPAPFYGWFSDAELDTCANALHRLALPGGRRGAAELVPSGKLKMLRARRRVACPR